MQSAIEEADAAIELGEMKITKAVEEQSELRAEADRRLADKEAEFDMSRFLYKSRDCC